MIHAATRRLVTPLALLALAVGTAAPAAAASKEQQQMMADIRMLQEQTQLLQNLIGTMMKRMDDAVGKLNARLDEQTNSTRKSLADQKLVIDGLSTDLRVVREKVDDNNVRIGTLAQEVESLRRAVQQINVPPATTELGPTAPGAPAAAPGTVPGAPAGAAGTAVAPPAAAPGAPEPAAPAGAAAAAGPPDAAPALPPNIPLGASPERIWNTAYGDYTAGQFDLAISGFQAYIMMAPSSDQADNAQVYIGNAYSQAGQYEKAVQAYETAIRTYPNGDAVAEAYYKEGLALGDLGQQDRAREAFQQVVDKFPDSPEGILAKQQLQKVPEAGTGR
jgi:tol-pal system protein YbgF